MSMTPCSLVDIRAHTVITQKTTHYVFSGIKILNTLRCIFHKHTVHLDIIKVFFYLPTDAQVNCLKNNFKIYIKIDIKTASKLD
jgi:hypothetical protein